LISIITGGEEGRTKLPNFSKLPNSEGEGGDGINGISEGEIWTGLTRLMGF
jgi:hypothetical protein